jgi:hypothetical protein
MARPSAAAGAGFRRADPSVFAPPAVPALIVATCGQPSPIPRLKLVSLTGVLQFRAARFIGRPTRFLGGVVDPLRKHRRFWAIPMGLDVPVMPIKLGERIAVPGVQGGAPVAAGRVRFPRLRRQSRKFVDHQGVDVIGLATPAGLRVEVGLQVVAPFSPQITAPRAAARALSR